MKPQPHIETSRSGSKVLIVRYHGDDFDAEIERAERRFNLVGDATITVIALPVGFGNDNR